MREILYRGKHGTNGDWIEGSLITVCLEGITCQLIFGADFKWEGNQVSSVIHAMVDPETVGQFTELRDKKGKRVFEGDILRFFDGENYTLYLCQWAYHRWTVRQCDIDLRDDLDEVFCKYAEVVGNIHDNPEMAVCEEA